MMNTGLSLRLTPTNSPSVRYPASIRSPIRLNHDELALSLKRVIGSTTTSPNGFDCQASKRRFAYTAGAAAVIADLDDDLRVTQRFFRARPTVSSPNNPLSNVAVGTPTRTINEQEPRNRAVSSLRDAGIGRDPADSPSRGWTDSPGSKPWAAKERIKAATAISFSPDGRFLAVGETGYKPRVLVFAADDDRSSDSPLAIMAEHSYGVQCVAFSPDSQFLASLGNINDGYLHIWRIGPRGSASLHSSAKCTSIVRHITWIGSALIAVGVRYIKVWRLDTPSEPASPRKARPSEFGSPMLMTPSNKSLPGRNAILGDLLDSTFTSVVAISSKAAAVCSDRGDVCMLDIVNGQQALRKVASTGFLVCSMAFDGDMLIIAGENHRLQALNVREFADSACDTTTGERVKSPTTKQSEPTPYIAAVGCIGQRIVTVDSRNGVEILKEFPFKCLENSDNPTSDIGVSDELKEVQPSSGALSSHIPRKLSSPVQKLPGHGSAVLGVQAIKRANSLNSSFFTWSSDGSIHFWNLEGALKGFMHVPISNDTLASDSHNELKMVRAFSDLNRFATGDKYGVLRIMEYETGKVIFEAQAHASEVLDIAVFDVDEATLVCSAGRDRIVQVFENKAGSTVLTQSLDEHVSVVNGLLFTPIDARLLSCSFDRTIVIRDRYVQESNGSITSAFVISKTINLKAAPVTMNLMDNENSLVVSSTDRSVMIYDLELRKATHTFKASDTERGDPVVLSALVHWRSSNGASVIAGVSSTDKSIRLYQEDGTLIGRDWGHTEGVNDIAIVYGDESREIATIVTVAADGTIFLWAASHDHPMPNTSFARADALVDQAFPSEPRAIKPLRRLLSLSDLANFRPASGNSTPKTSPIATPDPNRSPKLRPRASRMSLAQTPKLEPASSTTSNIEPAAPSRNHRSPVSPTNPKPSHNRANTDLSNRGSRRPSFDIRNRTKSAGNLKSPASSQPLHTNIHDSTTHIVRALRNYRRTLSRSSSTATLSLDTIREVEKELNMTAKALAEKAARSAGVGEEVMVRLFDEYSERIVRMLDERVERRMMEKERAEGIVEEQEAETLRESGKETEEERRGSV